MSTRALFAVAAPGLEDITLREARALGLQVETPSAAPGAGGPRQETGGVAFTGGRREIYLANLHLRTASRVLARLGDFYAAAFSELRKKASRLAWEEFLAPGQPVSLRVTSHKSRLYHSDAVAERVAGAIADRLGQPPAPAGEADDLAQLVLVRLMHDQCVISLDTSGALLHQRGYRLAAAKAPLRETLAAGMLLAAGWNGTAPLLDPFCGSGTIPIEAALMARNLPPGRNRRFAFMDWPDFDLRLWRSLLADAEAQVRSPQALPLILASDRDAGAIDSARGNAGRAGVENCLALTQRSISDIGPPAPASDRAGGRGWVVTNPPYGVRTSAAHDLRNLYARFGHVLRTQCPGWHVAMLCADMRLAHQVGLTFDRGRPLVNGGLDVRLLQARVPSRRA